MDCLIVIMWATNFEPDGVSYGFLAHNGGNGPVRVYHRDQYDARCDLGRDRAKDGPLPYFGNWQHARQFFLANPARTECQVDIRALRRPFPDIDLADVNDPRRCDGRDGHNVGEVQ